MVVVVIYLQRLLKDNCRAVYLHVNKILLDVHVCLRKGISKFCFSCRGRSSFEYVNPTPTK